MKIVNYEIYVEKPEPGKSGYIGTSVVLAYARDTALRMAKRIQRPVIVCGHTNTGERREVRFNPNGKADRLWMAVKANG